MSISRRGALGLAATGPALLLPAGAAALFTPGCGGGDSLGPLESYQLLAPDKAAGDVPVARPMPLGEEPALTLQRVLNDGFGAEMARTVHLAKQLVRHLGKGVGAAAYPPAVQEAANEPLLLLVGATGPGAEAPSAQGLGFPRWLRGPLVRPETRWLGLSANVEGDKALVQSLTGRLAAHAAAWEARGALTGPAPPLVEAYRMAMEVIAREWRPPNGAAGSLKSTAGTMEQRRLFAAVRENQAILREDGSLRPAADLLAEPRVAATVLHRLAQTRAIAHTAAPAELYAPFVQAGLPEGISPAAVLGPVRNFQAKLFSVWGGTVASGRPPRDIVDLVQNYGKVFPGEQAEILRIFLVTTFAGTVVSGGLSQKPADATATLARITELTEDVRAGRRGLRDAVGEGAQ
jgi:hypothetical protein